MLSKSLLSLSAGFVVLAFGCQAGPQTTGTSADYQAVSSSQTTLTEDARIEGLVYLWTSVKYNFAYIDELPFDWDTKLTEYLPQVRNANSTLDYYRVLQKLTAEIGDGHTSVYLPNDLQRKHFGGRPPIKTRRIDGRVYVERIYSPSITKVAPGDEIVMIDGTDVTEYAEKNVTPFIATSSPQDEDVRVYGQQLLEGEQSKPVRLTIRRDGSEDFEVVLNRSGYYDARGLPNYEFRTTPDNIAVASIRAMMDQKIVERLRNDLSQTRGLAGLIIDVRDNWGGNSSISVNIVAGLISKPVVTPVTQARVYNPVLSAWGREQQLLDMGNFTIQPSTPQWFEGPVLILTGPRTFSAAEDFVVYATWNGRATTVGEPTGGNTGLPIQLQLPGGGSAGISCAIRDRLKDGSRFGGVGIKPDHLVQTTPDDLRTGRDRTLEKAVGLIKDGQAISTRRDM